MYISIIYLKIAIKIEVKLIFFSCLNVANISNFDKICKLSTVSMCKIFRACKFHYCLGGCFKYANLCLTFAFFYLFKFCTLICFNRWIHWPGARLTKVKSTT